MANIPNTTIPYSALSGLKAANIDRYNQVISRIASEIANGDSQAINDAIFDAAYYSQKHPDTGQWGRGGGNSNVSLVHSGKWKVNDNKAPSGHKTWAETFINSPDDVYVQSNNDVVSMDPNTGKVLVNQKDSDGNWGAGPVGAVISGNQSGLDANMKTWLSGNALPGGPGKKVEAPSQDQINLLEYRPWTQKYANKYMTGGADSLMTMDKTSIQPEYSVAYLPGEFRDPNTWADWADDHKGHIPEGAWRRATMKPEAYTAAGNPRQNIWGKQNVGGVTDYRFLTAPGWNVKATDPRLISAENPTGLRQSSTPWDFTAPAHSQGNINWQDWTPQSMNLTVPDAAAWEGFLKATDTSPVTTPGLLTTGKGGPITFPA